MTDDKPLRQDHRMPEHAPVGAGDFVPWYELPQERKPDVPATPSKDGLDVA